MPVWLAPMLLLLGKVGNWLFDYFSPRSLLERLKLKTASKEAQVQVEDERLKATYQHIESETPPSDVVADLNKKFGGTP